MKQVKLYPETLQIKFEEINGLVSVVWKVKTKINLFQDKYIEGFFYYYYKYIFRDKDIIIEEDISKDKYIKFSINQKFLLEHFKNYYTKYIKKKAELKDKYLKPYNYISRKHKKIIMEDTKFKYLLDYYIDGITMNMYKNGVFYNPEDKKKDKFLEDINIFKKDNTIQKSPVKYLRNFEKMFDSFKPFYSKSFKVWRGFGSDHILKKDNIITQKIPFSTTLFPYIARDFVPSICCLLEIEVPKNFPVIFINEYISWEEEVILHQCELKVVQVIKTKRKNLYKYLKDKDIPHIIQNSDKKEEKKKIEDLFIVKCEINKILPLPVKEEK